MAELRKLVLTPKSKPNPRNNTTTRQEAQAVLNIIRMCERFHVLPTAGGLYDQDSLFVHLMFNVMIWESEREELDAAKAKAGANIKG